MWNWDPFREMKRIHNEMERMFTNAFLEGNHPLIESGNNKLPAQRDYFRMPSCDVRESENHLLLNFEIPGAKKEDIELNINKDSVEVKVDQNKEKEEKDEKKGSYQYSKVSNQFYRRIPLMTEIDPDKATANYENGVLRVELPKLNKEKDVKRIPIK